MNATVRKFADAVVKCWEKSERVRRARKVRKYMDLELKDRKVMAETFCKNARVLPSMKAVLRMSSTLIVEF